MIFTNSHDTDRAAVNDNGPNAKLTQCLNDVTADFARAFPPLKGYSDNAAFVNMRMVPAWRGFKSAAGPIITSATAKTGLWPSNRNAHNYTNGSHLLARRFTCPTGLPVKEDVGFEAEWLTPQQGPTQVLIGLVKKAPSQYFLIRQKALECFEKSTVTPTENLRKMLAEQAAAKKTKVPTAPNRKNPDSTYGLTVSEGVIAHCVKVDKNRADATNEAKAAKQRGEEKRVAKRTMEGETFDALLRFLCGSQAPMVAADLVGRGSMIAPDATKKVRNAVKEWDARFIAHQKSQFQLTPTPFYAPRLSGGALSENLCFRFMQLRTAYIIARYYLARSEMWYTDMTGKFDELRERGAVTVESEMDVESDADSSDEPESDGEGGPVAVPIAQKRSTRDILAMLDALPPKRARR